MMSSAGAGPAAEPRLHRLFRGFDPEAAAVVTILLGLIQLLLSVPIYYTDILPKLFLLPLIIGALIVAGGSLTMASERFPSRKLLQGSACSNLVGLLGTLLAFCLYCFTLKSIHGSESCDPPPDTEDHYYHSSHSRFMCPSQYLMIFCWCLTVLLILYDTAALLLHGFLSVCAVKALRTH